MCLSSSPVLSLPSLLCRSARLVADDKIVGPMMSSQASLLEIISNDFFGLPLITPAAIAARAETYLSTGASGGGSYLMGLQPDVFAEMRALARLILDMKTERDRERGW